MSCARLNRFCRIATSGWSSLCRRLGKTRLRASQGPSRGTKKPQWDPRGGLRETTLWSRGQKNTGAATSKPRLGISPARIGADRLGHVGASVARFVPPGATAFLASQRRVVASLPAWPACGVAVCVQGWQCNEPLPRLEQGRCCGESRKSDRVSSREWSVWARPSRAAASPTLPARQSTGLARMR